MSTKRIMPLLCLSFLSIFYSGCSNDDGFVSDTTESSDNGDTTTDDSDEPVETGEDHDEASDYEWDSATVVGIILNTTSITVNGEGATADGSVVTIENAGNYEITGDLTNGQIIVDTEDEGVVRLLLNGIDVTSKSSSPLYIANASKTVIYLEENTTNYLSDSDSYVYEGDEDEPDAALFSDDDLTIFGEGTLSVTGNYNEAIKSKDGLIITSGTLVVTSVDDGIQGKDYLIIKEGDITVVADGDGLKSNNDEDSTLGYLIIETGTITITSGADAIQAESSLNITDGDFNLISGGGHTAVLAEDDSAKALKAGLAIYIEKGTFSIDAADDGLHSNDAIIINDGTFSIATGDDGIHAEYDLAINGGYIDITTSYEGVESQELHITGGDVYITSSDDGLNAAGGNNNYLYIDGGTIIINAQGDGIDANGSIEMTGGTVVVNGPTGNNNGALDYDNTFKITGGILVASGSSGMAQAPSSSSTQSSVLFKFSSTMQAGTLLHIQDSSGNDIITYAPLKNYQSLVVSTPDFVDGSSYELFSGGSSTGSSLGGFYEDGTYSPGTSLNVFTVAGIITNIN
ncbi:MAG: carbohydrate-binding domain-containing protein [Leeuwenhoekiella sp.]